MLEVIVIILLIIVMYLSIGTSLVRYILYLMKKNPKDYFVTPDKVSQKEKFTAVIFWPLVLYVLIYDWINS